MRHACRLALSLSALCLLSSVAHAQAVGDSIRLTLRSGGSVEGTFLERTTELWRLTVPSPDPRLVPVTDVRRAQRQVVRDPRRLKSQGMWLGMLIGTAAMVAVFETEINTGRDPGLAGLLIIPLATAGAVGGAVAGYVVGSLREPVVWREVK